MTLEQTREGAAASQMTATERYLELIGVPRMPALTSPFDPGYDPATLASHLEQSGRKHGSRTFEPHRGACLEGERHDIDQTLIPQRAG